MPNSLALACVAFAASVTALAQPASDPVSFAGTVMNTATGAPVRYARVALEPKGVETQTDVTGAFRFTQLEPGDYLVMAAKAGFTAADGHEDGYEVSLTASQEKYTIGLTPLSSIRGRILDDGGEPVEGATVLALQSTIEAGRRRNQIVNAVVTNDRGEYRIPLLRAGRYMVKASGQFAQRSYYGANAPPPASRETFSPVYFGGSPEAAGASLVPLQPGTEAHADFSVTLQPGHNILGRIANLKAHSTANLQLSSGDEDLGVNSSSLELATGQFEIHGVLDGAYRLRAYQRGDGDQLLFSEQNIVVGGRDVEGVKLTLGSAGAAKGKLSVQGPSDTPAVDFRAILEAQDSLLALNQEQKRRVSEDVLDGKFEIPSVFPGKYWIDFWTRDGLYVSSARAGDTDLLATQELVAGSGGAPEIEIVLRADGGSISGTIAAEAAGDAEVFVLLVPESCNRPAKVTGAEPGNGFSFSDVAPGNYRVHAWKEAEEIEFGSPTALCALARGGARAEVKAGEVTKVELQKLSEEPK
jgi:hypothetical protein